MKTKLYLLLTFMPGLLLAAEPNDKAATKAGTGECCNAGTSCCAAAAQATPVTASQVEEKASDAKRYPLRGVIVEVRKDDSALRVKHENIPGFMPAMTMIFKVDAATLETVQIGQTIAATLFRKDDAFWLTDVKPAAAVKE